MRKSILVLSALLTLVVSGFCLQSCSSEYDEYTTEEYGYYTEEEIAAIKTLGDKYGVTINIDENTYEVKKSLEEFEEEIKYHASLIGEYEVFLDKNRGEDMFIVRKKELKNSRLLTRAAESGSSGSWGYTFHKGVYDFALSISWTQSTDAAPGIASGSIYATSTYASYTGTLQCYIGPRGAGSVTFSGHIFLGYYTYYITQGSIDIATKNGSFLFEKDYYSSNSNSK